MLVVLVVLFLAGGYGGRRAGWYGDGGGIEYFAYIIAVVLLIWVGLRLVGIA